MKKLSLFLVAVLLFTMLPNAAYALDTQKEITGINERIGITHVGGLYNFTTKDFLNEGVDKIIEAGSKTIKLWLTYQYKDVYSFNSNWETIANLTDLAKSPYYKNAFSKPIKNYILEAYEFSAYNWRAGLSSAQANNISEEFYNLTKYLLQTYTNTGKTFVLQNWEGDNAIRLDLLPTEQEKSTAITGMIDWLNARQDGINRAKADTAYENVNVFGAVEINKISTTINDAQRVVDIVVPYTRADLYSYSNWETGTDARLLRDNLNYLESKAPDSSSFGRKNLYMGEFGAPENYLGSEANQLNQTKIQLETALMWGVQYALYWELYCNEAANTYTGRPINSDLRGFWLIKPDGSYTQTYAYLKSFCSKTLSYDSLGNWSKIIPNTICAHRLIDNEFVYRLFLYVQFFKRVL